MPRYSRHRAGLSDRRQKLAPASPVIQPFNEPVTDCVDAVFDLLDGHATLGSGLNGIVTKNVGLVFDLLDAEITQ